MEGRLAKLEQKVEHVVESIGDKMDHVVQTIDRFVTSQEKHNILFYQTRDEVIVIKASARAAWFTLSIFGAAVVTLSGGLAWIVTTLIAKGHL